jgi:pyridoxine 4-dehydrogenase
MPIDELSAAAAGTWTLHQGRHVLAIPGTGDPKHLEDNIAAAALELSPDELVRLA